VGDNAYRQCDVGSWTGIIQVAAGLYHTVGVKTDGTVVAVGDNAYRQCDVGSWTGIVKVAAGTYHTVGVKTDGTLVAVGDKASGQCNVGGWAGIIQVTAGTYHTVGLKSDGTVVTVGLETELAKWNLWVTDFESGLPADWQLIAGVIAVIVVGLVIFFVRRRRVAWTCGLL